MFSTDYRFEISVSISLLLQNLRLFFDFTHGDLGTRAIHSVGQEAVAPRNSQNKVFMKTSEVTEIFKLSNNVKNAGRCHLVILKLN